MTSAKARYSVARYARLSREDGDKPESDSIANQLRLIGDFCALHPELTVAGDYVDDGYTGTSFDRPDFRRMLADIDAGRIDCVIVKDLSRFGRDYIDMGYYLERWLPSRGVRFIAVGDGVDSLRGPYDMLLPLKNVFNTQYARDISAKVRGSLAAKQRRGQFVGAFAAYGYVKDPEDKNHLIVDPVAARVVERIFTLAAAGVGQIRIAKLLNDQRVPCPSEYKRLMGQRYTNGRRLDATRYWTYATVHRILRSPVYTGAVVSGRSVRPSMHARAKAAPAEDWIVVEGMHEPIVSRALWDAAQAQVSANARVIDFTGSVSLFAGLLRCGECGRALCKTTWNGRVTYACGSYHRYGPSACSPHYIGEDALVAVILSDLNRLLRSVPDLQSMAERQRAACPAPPRERELAHLQGALERVRRLKQSAYEDYRDGLLTREEFARYKADYDRQEDALDSQIAAAEQARHDTPPDSPWTEQLLRNSGLSALDRATLAQTVKSIRVFADRHLEITYLFSDEVSDALEKTD